MSFEGEEGGRRSGRRDGAITMGRVKAQTIVGKRVKSHNVDDYGPLLPRGPFSAHKTTLFPYRSSRERMRAEGNAHAHARLLYDHKK